MQLRLSENSFHFIISAHDLKTLREGKSIKNNLSLGSSSFSYAIKPYEDDVFKLYLTPLSVVLFVSLNRLHKFNSQGVSKNRLKTLQDGARIILELDPDSKDQFDPDIDHDTSDQASKMAKS